MEYASAGQIGLSAKVSQPLSRAQSLLSRLSSINGTLVEHLCSLEKVESLVVGCVPTQSTSSDREQCSGGCFLADLEVVIASIEAKLPEAGAAVHRVKNAF